MPLLDDPAVSSRVITPSDTEDLSGVRYLYIGSNNVDVAIMLKDDTAAVTYPSMPRGTILPVQAKRVMATNTTGGAVIIAWY